MKKLISTFCIILIVTLSFSGCCMVGQQSNKTESISGMWCYRGFGSEAMIRRCDFMAYFTNRKIAYTTAYGLLRTPNETYMIDILWDESEYMTIYDDERNVLLSGHIEDLLSERSEIKLWIDVDKLYDGALEGTMIDFTLRTH